MIFVTVGEQLPFDRLIRAVDNWAIDSNEIVFAQIGSSKIKPRNIKCENFLEPVEFKNKFESAELVIAHAGMGTIITALELQKPIIVVPRRAELGEHRNNHQLATAEKFMKLEYIEVAFDEAQLLLKLKELNRIKQNSKQVKDRGPSPYLIKTIRDFLTGSSFA
ncbi:MAG: glycosyltransferase [Desulforhopalus sp.]